MQAFFTRAGLLVLTITLSAACASTQTGDGEEIEVDGDEYGSPSRPTTRDISPGPGAGGMGGMGGMGGGAPVVRSESLPSVSFEKTAEANWAKGEKAFAEEEYAAAQRYFSHIRTKFPYSAYALLADLRIADSLFGRERYLEAIDAYQNFARMHPTHEQVPYARFRVGLCYVKQIPSDWFILPPSREKDQTSVKDAERALRDFLELHPTHDNAVEAKKQLLEVRTKLMEHERYVADFYRTLDRDRARVGRLEVIRRDFPDVGLDEALLLEIAELWAKLEEPEKAKSAVKELEEKFPQSKSLAKAKSLVKDS